jgi:hypothetical protein
MATWIVHLRLAQNMLEQIPGLDEANFALGNVAPDSGVPDEKWETFDPPPEVTHFRRSARKRHFCADLDFYRDYLTPNAVKQEERSRASFLLGYFFHLVTDNLWHLEIVAPTFGRFIDKFRANRKFIWEVKHDWYGLDYKYVREHPGSIFWTVFLRSAYTEGFLDFLPKKAVDRQLKYIQDLYRKADEETERWWKNRPGIYLMEEAMDRFVERGTECLFRTYRLLRDRPVPSGSYSILEVNHTSWGGPA